MVKMNADEIYANLKAIVDTLDDVNNNTLYKKCEEDFQHILSLNSFNQVEIEDMWCEMVGYEWEALEEDDEDEYEYDPDGIVLYDGTNAYECYRQVGMSWKDFV